MAIPNFRNIYETAQDSACKWDKGVQLKMQEKSSLPSLACHSPGWLGAERWADSWASCFLFLMGELGWCNSLFFDLTGSFPSPFLSYSPHGHILLLSGIISAPWAQAFVWCFRHQIYCMLSEWPKEARFLLLKTPLAQMTKGSLNCRHKGWERERKGRDQSGVITILPSQQHTAGTTAVLRVHGTVCTWNSSKLPASEKGNQYSCKGVACLCQWAFILC